MKKAIYLPFLLVLLMSSFIYSQDVISLYPTQTNSVTGDSCFGPGSERHDNGTFENGYGLNNTVTDARWILKFRPVSYPWHYTKFCVGITRTSGGSDSLTYQVVV